MTKKEGNIIKLTLDSKNLPQLTDEEKLQIESIEAMPDELIDYSDAPYLPDAEWMKATTRTRRKQQ